LDILYPDNVQHPIQWIEQYADMNSIKTDFFEQKVTNYAKASSLDFNDL
jgi:ribonucleoside-diphosphate reductase beta chain